MKVVTTKITRNEKAREICLEKEYKVIKKTDDLNGILRLCEGPGHLSSLSK